MHVVFVSLRACVRLNAFECILEIARVKQEGGGV